MPTVRIENLEQLTKVIGVLDRFGGTYHGVGGDEEYLIVNQEQFDELVKTGPVCSNGARAKQRAKRTTKPREKKL